MNDHRAMELYVQVTMKFIDEHAFISACRLLPTEGRLAIIWLCNTHAAVFPIRMHGNH